MFGLKRERADQKALSPRAEFHLQAQQIGTFKALTSAIAKLDSSSDASWVFSEIMQGYPDPAVASAELHLLMGMYLLKTNALNAAEIEFARAGNDFVSVHLPLELHQLRKTVDVKNKPLRPGLNRPEVAENDIDVRLNEAIEFWALENLFESKFGKRGPTRPIVTGLLTHRNFPTDADALTVFLGVSIADEQILTPARLLTLKKAAPIFVRDTATQTLLDYFKVPNFLLGPASAAINLQLKGKSISKPVWVGINQWSEPEIERVAAADLFKNSKLQTRVLDNALRRQVIRTSIPALAQLAIGLNRDTELKARPKFRPFISNFPNSPAEQKFFKDSYQQLLNLLETNKNLADSFKVNLATVETNIEDKKVLPPTSLQASEIERLRNSAVTMQSVVEAERHIHIAFGFDQNLLNYFEPVLQQIQAHASFSADIHILGRGFDAVNLKSLLPKFPHFGFHFYPFDEVNYGDAINTLDHITVSTMDRLLLADLLPTVNQILYLDTDLMVFEDLWELGKIRLQNQALAARLITTEVWGSAYKTFHKAAAKLPVELVDDLRKTLLFDYRLLETQMVNAGVLLINLKLMRQENFIQRYLRLVEFARFNDQDVLSLWAAGRIHELGTEWNWTIAQTEIVTPKIIHWAGPRKPWKKDFVWLQSEFKKSLADCEPLN